MEALPYLLKVNICWVVFYGCYWLLFRKHTFSLAPTPPLGKKHLKAFYEDTTIDLQDSVPPTTSLRRFGVTLIHSLPDKPVDLKIKYRKK